MPAILALVRYSDSKLTSPLPDPPLLSPHIFLFPYLPTCTLHSARAYVYSVATFNYNSSPSSQDSSTTSSYTSTTTGTVASHQLQYPPLPHLPKCKSDACPNPVYCDPYFGQFDYCSPACRNEHLLEREQKRLKDDVMDGIKKLRELQPPLSAESTSTLGADSSRKSKIVITKSPGQALGIIFGPYQVRGIVHEGSSSACIYACISVQGRR